MNSSNYQKNSAHPPSVQKHRQKLLEYFDQNLGFLNNPNLSENKKIAISQEYRKNPKIKKYFKEKITPPEEEPKTSNISTTQENLPKNNLNLEYTDPSKIYAIKTEDFLKDQQIIYSNKRYFRKNSYVSQKEKLLILKENDLNFSKSIDDLQKLYHKRSSKKNSKKIREAKLDANKISKLISHFKEYGIEINSKTASKTLIENNGDVRKSKTHLEKIHSEKVYLFKKRWRREYNRKYYQEHQKKAKEYQKKYTQKHKRKNGAYRKENDLIPQEELDALKKLYSNIPYQFFTKKHNQISIEEKIDLLEKTNGNYSKTKTLMRKLVEKKDKQKKIERIIDALKHFDVEITPQQAEKIIDERGNKKGGSIICYAVRKYVPIEKKPQKIPKYIAEKEKQKTNYDDLAKESFENNYSQEIQKEESVGDPNDEAIQETQKESEEKKSAECKQLRDEVINPSKFQQAPMGKAEKLLEEILKGSRGFTL